MLKRIRLVSLPCLLVVGVLHAQGTWVDTTFVPPSLGFENAVRIYLPEGYDPGGTTDYPAIYWLHGWNTMGGPGHVMYCFNTKLALDSLISSGQIEPVLVVKPNGTCPPYNGSCWVNSELYGDYEDYVVYDLVDFMESNFCVISDPAYRSIAGHSMGGSGSMNLALRHPDRYSAVASHAGLQDYLRAFVYLIPCVIEESPESTPPYTYDWGNGFYTDCLIMCSGAYSPNFGAPDSVDFLLDENAEMVDSVYALWELHNPSHMVKLMPLPIDLGIFFDCGQDDGIAGCYEANCGYSDTLNVLGVDHVFQDLPGVAHGMNLDRFIQEFLFLDACMTGIEGGLSLPSAVSLHPAFPNPFSVSTAIKFDLPQASTVHLDIYDISGRLVEDLVSGSLLTGEHNVIWNPDPILPDGCYLIVLDACGQRAVRRCVKLD